MASFSAKYGEVLGGSLQELHTLVLDYNAGQFDVDLKPRISLARARLLNALDEDRDGAVDHLIESVLERTEAILGTRKPSKVMAA